MKNNPKKKKKHKNIQKAVKRIQDANQQNNMNELDTQYKIEGVENRERKNMSIFPFGTLSKNINQVICLDTFQNCFLK